MCRMAFEPEVQALLHHGVTRVGQRWRIILCIIQIQYDGCVVMVQNGGTFLGSSSIGGTRACDRACTRDLFVWHNVNAGLIISRSQRRGDETAP